MKRKKAGLILMLTLVSLLVFTAVALAGNGLTPAATAPSNGNTTPGQAATMFGNTQNGSTVYSSCISCHGAAGAGTPNYPGLANVTNPSQNSSIDPALYDVNPAIFARNMDAFIQHGSTPSGLNAMPAWGDKGWLTQAKIADVEAYLMSLSNVKWPTLTLSGTTLSGSNFVPGSTVQLYQNGSALSGTVTPDSNGNITTTVNIPTAQQGKFTANYATLNVSGIYPNGDKTQAQIGMDGTKGATYTVASVSYGAAVSTANMPKTGSNSIILALIGVVLTAFAVLLITRKPNLGKQ